MSFEQELKEDRRLSLLLVLRESGAYTANGFLLQGAIGSIYGHNVSVDVVKSDLAWLHEQGLVVVKTTGDVAVATLTVRGLDAAAGRANVPGVKRPMP
jgi:hypothetical protein